MVQPCTWKLNLSIDEAKSQSIEFSALISGATLNARENHYN